MDSKCKCLGCQHIERHLPKSYSNCIPTESDDTRFDQENEPTNCIPVLNESISKRYERDVKTSDLYRTVNLPGRFENSCSLNGYGSQYRSHHPIYRTTSSDYGWMPPNPHIVPHRFYPRSNEFSELLTKSGMYRNHSLNTVMDKSRV